ncbi:uncharacterized protein LOC120893104 [Ictidomys tridecemlineatus]|uniref:uncharacterized protein LOC120893104 n=1 Tax=Ictidomys tridecemlineatus TaxID=43179 RepID=UPI001A9D7626|nr:uncharacterized protein LOC120893104 [Ictidomys tridecemlineatus]
MMSERQAFTNGCRKIQTRIDSGLAGRKKKITALRTKRGHQKEFLTPPLAHEHLPNYNQPKTLARVPRARPCAPRPARPCALASSSRPGLPEGGRAPPHPRGLGSPPAQPCAPSADLALHVQPGHTRGAPAFSRAVPGVWDPICAAHGRGCWGAGAELSCPLQIPGTFTGQIPLRRGDASGALGASPPLSSAAALSLGGAGPGWTGVHFSPTS